MGVGRLAGINLKQAAAALDVHYMTAYRYVRTGRLPARRVGTGWVVDPDDLATFVLPARDGRPDDRAGRPRCATGGTGCGARWWWATRPAHGGSSNRRSPPATHPRIATSSCWSGRSTTSADAPRSPGPVAEEYLATATAARLVARLGARFRRPGRSRGTVVFGAPLGEHHTLAISVVADLVRLEGFSCLELGANVPPEAFAGAASGAYRLIAVGIGVTRPSHLDAVRRTVEAVHGVDAGIPVVLGGQAANRQSRR